MFIADTQVIKFLWLEGCWIQRQVLSLTPLCTKASNAKKPVRYTSIKKAKPKSINDIAKLLQQKSKETNERKPFATNTTKPATPNQSTDAMLISNAKVQTSTINPPAKDSSESAIPVHTKPVQDTLVDLQAVTSPTGSSLNETASRLNSILIRPAVDFAYSNVIDQNATEGLNKKKYTQISNANDLASNFVDSYAGSTTNDAHGDVTTNITQVSSQTSEVISSYEVDTQNHDAFEEHTPQVVACEETVNMADAIMTTPEVSSVFQGEELCCLSEDVNVNVNIAQAQNYPQPLPQHFPNWSSNVIADKQSSDGQILNQAFPESLPDGSAIQDISEAFCSRSGEVCQVSPSTEYIAGVSLFKSTEDLSVARTVSACLNKAVKVDGLSEMSADVQSSISLKDPVLAQTDILVEENQTEAAEMLPEEQLDPIQRLFLHKIREYSTKSQASAGPVDAGADYEKAFSEELSKLQRLYGGGDLTNFPGFKFSEPVLDESDSK